MSGTATGAPTFMAAPAPWTLNGKGWLIPLHTPFSTTPKPLPEGSYAPLERGSTADQSERFHGGTGFVMIVRYSSGDVGPYDELIYIPGLFRRPGAAAGQSHAEYFPAVTRIYVSIDDSTINGRKNWGIPKHRAVFNWSPTTEGSRGTLLEVSHPEQASKPFFRCVLRDSPWMPFTLPVSTSWLEHPLAKRLMQGYELTLYQPPVPRDPTDPAKVASDKTYLVKPSSSGRSRLATISPAPGTKDAPSAEDWSEFGDGEGFPRFKPWSQWTSFHLTFTMQFPIPLEV